MEWLSMDLVKEFLAGKADIELINVNWANTSQAGFVYLQALLKWSSSG